MNSLKELIAEQRKESFNPEYRDRVSDAQVLGIMLSRYFGWVGEDILHTCMYGLEDSNYHSVNQKLKEVFSELTEGANV